MPIRCAVAETVQFWQKSVDKARITSTIQAGFFSFDRKNVMDHIHVHTSTFN